MDSCLQAGIKSIGILLAKWTKKLLFTQPDVWLTEWYNGKRGKTHDLMYLSLVNAASHKYDYKYSLLKDKEGKCLISWKGKNPVGLLRKI